MVRSTNRPLGVSLATGWAAIGGAHSLFEAVDTGMAGTIVADASWSIGTVAAGMVLLSGIVGFGLLIVAGGLFRVRPWARTAGMVLFGLFALLNLHAVLDGSPALDGVLLPGIELALNVVSLGVLLVNRGAFVSERPDISGGSASEVGRQ